MYVHRLVTSNQTATPDEERLINIHTLMNVFVYFFKRDNLISRKTINCEI